MQVIIISVHVLAAVILVLTVLLQAGKNSGMGAAFGGASGSVFGARGPATLISKITCVAAVVFMCTSLQMAISQGGVGKGSLMDEYQASGAPVANPMATPAVPEGAQATPAVVEQPAAPVPADADQAAPVTVETPAASENGAADSSATEDNSQ